MRTIKELAREALDIQNAVNLVGLAKSFARAMTDLAGYVSDTVERNHHPVTVLWLDKMCQLAGIQIIGSASRQLTNLVISNAYAWARDQLRAA
jgi:hypothetical protein